PPRAPCVLPSFPTRRSSDLFFHFAFHFPCLNFLCAHTPLPYDRGIDSKYAMFSAGNPSASSVLTSSWPVGEIPKLAWNVRTANRSEEHTSELQSRSDLVCRL